MPTLNIEGRKVTVDDSFLSLTPEAQNATVDEIATSISQSKDKPEEARWDHKVGAAIDGVAQAITFQTSDEIAAGMATGFGVLGDYDSALAEERARMQENKELAGGYEMGGQIVGSIAGAGGLVKSGVTLLKSGVPLTKQLARSATEASLHGAAHGAGAAEEGDRIAGAASGAAIGAVTGVVAPLAIGAATSGGRMIKEGVTKIKSPTQAAKNEVTKAIARDADQGVLNGADEALALQNGQPIINADRGGETTRALARAAANVNPEARATIERVASDRFEGQSGRAVEFMKKIAGGEIDDIALKDRVEAGARKANEAAYKKARAFNFGDKHPIEIDNILKRIPSAAFTNAKKIAKAEGRGLGEQLIASIDEATDTVTLSRSPSMRELDYIQRGLRGLKESEFKSGSGDVGNAYRDLHKELLSVLDDANPLFQKARLGASAAFGAEDAIEAGRNFANPMKSSPMLEKAFSSYSEAEKKGFRVSYAAAVIDKINRGGDRANVIKSTFQNPISRDKIKVVFGPSGARELEGFVRIETTMDRLRGALGNSTTARQLQELGLVGGGSATYGLATGDYNSAAIGATFAGLRFGNQKLNERVLREIGNLLASDDAAGIAKVAAKGKLSPEYFKSIKIVTDLLMDFNAPIAGAAGAGALRE